MRMFIRFGVITALALLVACEKGGTPPQQGLPPRTDLNTTSYMVKGVVKELKSDGKIVIRHEEIPGYMEAMTMPFNVKDPKELAGLQSNDVVSFRLQVTDRESWIDQVKKTGMNPVESTTADTPSVRIVRDAEPLEVGDLLPDRTFTNELGRVVNLREFRGRALALTFIFTRCPLPDFCPRLSNHFADAAKALAGQAGSPTNWHLLSISFDPEYDTPRVLKNYAERYKYDPSRWSFVTGDLSEIDVMAEQFGLLFGRDTTPFNFNHNLRTVVIDASGRVQKIFIGNEWTVGELVEEIVQAAGK